MNSRIRFEDIRDYLANETLRKTYKLLLDFNSPVRLYRFAADRLYSINLIWLKDVASQRLNSVTTAPEGIQSMLTGISLIVSAALSGHFVQVQIRHATSITRLVGKSRHCRVQTHYGLKTDKVITTIRHCEPTAKVRCWFAADHPFSYPPGQLSHGTADIIKRHNTNT